jgi:hypothetical protein
MEQTGRAESRLTPRNVGTLLSVFLIFTTAVSLLSPFKVCTYVHVILRTVRTKHTSKASACFKNGIFSFSDRLSAEKGDLSEHFEDE